MLDLSSPDITVSRTERLGQLGEELARDHLLETGYRIVATNFTLPVGRNTRGVQVTGEIDIIALDGPKLCFIEVKTRRSDEFTPISTAVDLRKQRQITRTARVYRRLFNIIDVPHRYDVITVLMPKHADPVIEHLKAFWTEAAFRKRSWNDNYWYDHR